MPSPYPWGRRLDNVQIEVLDWADGERVEQARALIVAAFDNPERYGEARVAHEISRPAGLFYRQFFVAMQAGRVLGVAGVKALDWASHTHALYLSAVDKDDRGQGIGRALVDARLEWLKVSFGRGRILVSTRKPRRFKSLGFRVITGSRKEGRWLMLKEFD